MTNRPCLRVGVGGPVGSGKTALLRHLCMRLRKHYNMAVVTNDIDPTNTELADLAAACNQRLSKRLAA